MNYLLHSAKNEDSYKLSRWHEIARLVDRVTDKLGRRVDPGIKVTVIAILALGFPTEGSCEGHLSFGVKAPWIDIGRNLPKRYVTLFDTYGLPHKPGVAPHVNDVFAKYPKLAALRDTNIRLQQRLTLLLSEFYALRETPSDSHLVLEEIGCYGAVRLW